MSNKQTAVEWYIIERHNIEIQSRLGKISSTQYDEQLIKIEEQAKETEKQQIIKYQTQILQNHLTDESAKYCAEKHYNEIYY